MRKLIVLINLIISICIYSEVEKIKEKIDLSKESIVEESKGYSSFILGGVNGEIVFGEDVDTMYPLASITKMMTVIIVYDAIRSGEISKNDIVTIDKETVNVGGSRVWMRVGQKISVEDLLKATSLHSANNAAYALAKYVGKGNVNDFVEKMRNKVKEWGLEDEVDFHTPTGLPEDMTGKRNDVGSARGIYELSRKALEYPELVEVASMKEGKIYGDVVIKNRNALLGQEGIYGLKTGHYDAAGYNLTVASKKDNMNIVYVVLGGKDEKTREEKIINDLSKFYDEYTSKFFLNKEKPVWSYKLDNGSIKNIEVYPEENYSKIIKKGSKIEFEVSRLSQKLSAVSGEKVGEYVLLVDGENVKRGNLVVRENIGKRNRTFEEFKL